jgi:hypothetical protein
MDGFFVSELAFRPVAFLKRENIFSGILTDEGPFFSQPTTIRFFRLCHDILRHPHQAIPLVGLWR